VPNANRIVTPRKSLVAWRNVPNLSYRSDDRIFDEAEGDLVKRAIGLGLILAAVVAIAAPGVSARPETTAPGYNFVIKVTIKKGGQLIWSANQVKRGWLTHFRVHNADKVAHRFSVGGIGPKKPIAPGKTVKVGGYSEDRGQFPFKVDGKIRGWFVVN